MKRVLMLAMLLAFSGCMNVDYTGRKFSAQKYVQYTESADEVDLDNYTLIGRFTVTAKTKTHPYYVEEEVLERAREYGGDILLRTGVKTVPHGAYTPNEREFGAPRTAARKNRPEERAHFGGQKPLSSDSATAERREFQYLLYKKTSEVNRQLGY